jgi:asparagine synthase (glutamine-hydrolysing)
LAIIDLQTGDPPVSSEDETIGAVLNGEIYNYRELRASLRDRGHRFSTDGDTEVIAHLAEEDEPVALARQLDGMFALAIWDERKERLILARDRFGKKPLYYWHQGGRLVFASEIKSILMNPHVPRRLNEAAIAPYLTFGYVATPDTFFEGVHSVPPGHVLVAEPHCEPRLERYWEPEFPGSSDVERIDLSFDAMKLRVRELLREAVERRLISDVPLGAFLSGGIDSSAVVALMAQASDRPVATFTIGFEDVSGFDERPFARAVADRYKTEHTEFVVEPHAADLIERLVWHHDQPFGDSSALPTYILSELTSGHVKVALSGDGGDELFAGYERFAAARALARYEVLPQRLRTTVRQAAQVLAPIARTPRSARLARMMTRSDLSAPGGLLAWVSFTPQEWKTQLLPHAATVAPNGYMKVWDETAGADPLDRLLNLNLRTYLLDDLLPKVDRMSMAHGLEVRSPFLDRALAEYAFRLPPAARLRRLSLKRILRAAVADLLPAELLQRPKRGFGVPLDRWFRTELAPYVTGMLCSRDTRVGQYLSASAVQAMIRDHHNGSGNHGHALWTLLTLEVFLRSQSW